jgi:NADH-quinone oxidoreductase subunit G
VAATWGEAFSAIAGRVAATTSDRIGAIAGDLAAVEEMFALKQLMASLGVKNLDGRGAGEKHSPALGRASYIFNPTIAGIDHADAILIIGADPRHEAAVLNARIRKRWREAGVPVALIGEAVDLTYPYEHLGAGPQTLADVATGAHAFAKVLAAAKRPLILLGQGALARSDGPEVLALAAKIAIGGEREEDWNGLAILHTAAARVGALDLGFVPGENGLDTIGMVAAAATKSLDVLFLLGADEIAMNALGSAFVVYIGTHGDNGAHRADVILPGAAYTEKSGTYVNTEGRVQMAARAGFPPGDAREDWAILRALSDVLGKRLPFDSLAELRARLYAAYPHFGRVDQIEAGSLESVKALAGYNGKTSTEPFKNVIEDFYLTNPIARASAVMAECSALAASRPAMAAE